MVAEMLKEATKIEGKSQVPSFFSFMYMYIKAAVSQILTIFC